MHHRVIPLLVIIALAVSLGLKGGRYLKSAPPEQDANIAHHIARFMKDFGWVVTDEGEGSGHGLFKTLTFTKRNCDGRIAIALLGNNAELEGFARISMGGNVGFFQNNEFVKRQSAVKLQIAEAQLSLGAFFGMGQSHAIPVLAISPTPPDLADTCAPPAKKFWRNFAARHDHQDREMSPID